MENHILRGSVWLDKETNEKFVFQHLSELHLIQNNPERFEFISNTPHENEDFSYKCYDSQCQCNIG